MLSLATWGILVEEDGDGVLALATWGLLGGGTAAVVIPLTATHLSSPISVNPTYLSSPLGTDPTNLTSLV